MARLEYNKIHTKYITAEGTAETVTTFAQPTAYNQIKRGDFEFIKVSDGTMKRLSNVAFKVTALEKDGKTMDAYRKKLMIDFSFMSYAPIIFISAKTGQRLDRLYELIKYVDDQNAVRIPTGRLNQVLADAQARVQPPTDKGKRLKVYYMTQASTRPPTLRS